MISEKLDSLSDEELFLLAERMGLYLPEGLDRVFVLEELVEAFEEESDENVAFSETPYRTGDSLYAHRGRAIRERPVEEGAPMEARYNETLLRAIVRDPSWAFAYWDISDADRSLIKADEAGGALFLRVGEVGSDGEARRDYFDIPVTLDDSRWYINLPAPKARYRIELFARAGSGGRARALARAPDLAVPRQTLDEGLDSLDPAMAELLRLSGLESLDIEPERDDNPQRILKSGADVE